MRVETGAIAVQLCNAQRYAVTQAVTYIEHTVNCLGLRCVQLSQCMKVMTVKHHPDEEQGKGMFQRNISPQNQRLEE